MMRPDDFAVYLRASPFKPFRIYLVSGKTYEIRHPEMVRVGKTTMHIFFAEDPNKPEDPYDRAEMISLMLIERDEPVLTPLPA